MLDNQLLVWYNQTIIFKKDVNLMLAGFLPGFMVGVVVYIGNKIFG